jgi:hypothetical protein
MWAVRIGHLPLVQALIAAGADVDATDENGDSAQRIAVRFRFGVVMQALYQARLMAAGAASADAALADAVLAEARSEAALAEAALAEARAARQSGRNRRPPRRFRGGVYFGIN